MIENTEVKMQKIAQKVLDQIPSSENYGCVLTILMIISLVFTLIRIIQECEKDKVTKFSTTEKYSYFNNQIKTLTTRRSWFTKMMLKKAIRKELGKENYKIYGTDVMNSILNVGENLTEDEIITLVEAANV